MSDLLTKKAKSYYRLGVMHNKKGNKHKANYCFYKYEEIIDQLNKEWELEDNYIEDENVSYESNVFNRGV